MSFARHLAGYKGDKRYVQPQRRESTGDDWNLQDAHCQDALEFLQGWIEFPAVLHNSLFKVLPNTEFYFFSFLFLYSRFLCCENIVLCITNALSLSPTSIFPLPH